MITVKGKTIAGMAVAARLARLGHKVSIIPVAEPRPIPDHFEFPAAWRDFFKKTGRPMTGSLGTLGLELAPAPPITYLLPTGIELTLPDGRGDQFAAISVTLGSRQAKLWRDLLDALDTVWMVLRRHGLERPKAPTRRREQQSLWLDQTLFDLADRAGELAPIILAQRYFCGTDSPRAPGLLAVRQSLIRTFGRHRLITQQGKTAQASALLHLLQRRLEERGVSEATSDSEYFFCAQPRLPRRLFRSYRPALQPLAAPDEPGSPSEIIDLTRDAPIRTIRAEDFATSYDYSQLSPDLSAGIAPDDAKSWLSQQTPSHSYASTTCLAGSEAWGELLSAALSVYSLHERLTGQDCRPTNRSFQMPPLPHAR